LVKKRCRHAQKVR
jgi:hypothetical protein